MPERAASRALFSALSDGLAEVHVSVEAIQEVVRHRMRRSDRASALIIGRALLRACHVHAYDEEVAAKALDLIDQCPVRGRDAIHAATASTSGFDTIVTLDQDFALVPGLAVISPSEALG